MIENEIFCGGKLWIIPLTSCYNHLGFLMFSNRKWIINNLKNTTETLVLNKASRVFWLTVFSVAAYDHISQSLRENGFTEKIIRLYLVLF